MVTSACSCTGRSAGCKEDPDNGIIWSGGETDGHDSKRSGSQGWKRAVGECAEAVAGK